MIAVLSAFSIALIASWGLTRPVRALALRVGMVDLPGPRKVHLQPVPLLGGLAIYCGVVLAILVSITGPTRAQVAGILAGATLLAVVGVLDDRGLLHHEIKLLVAMPLAALALLASGIHAQLLTSLVPGRAGQVLDAGASLIWVTGVTAAFSILDHMDGLCAGVVAIGSAFFTVLAMLNGQLLVSTLGAALLGAAVGFLRWNFSPAQIFMGDGGAMFLGFMMATLSLKLRLASRDASNWLIPVFILGVPIFDTTLVSVSRWRRGLLPFATPGKDHTAHRLANVGLGQRKAVLGLYGLAVGCGLLALVIGRLPSELRYALAGAVIIAALAAIALLERAPYEQQTKKSTTA